MGLRKNKTSAAKTASSSAVVAVAGSVLNVEASFPDHSAGEHEQPAKRPTLRSDDTSGNWNRTDSQVFVASETCNRLPCSSQAHRSVWSDRKRVIIRELTVSQDQIYRTGKVGGHSLLAHDTGVGIYNYDEKDCRWPAPNSLCSSDFSNFRRCRKAHNAASGTISVGELSVNLQQVPLNGDVACEDLRECIFIDTVLPCEECVFQKLDTVEDHSSISTSLLSAIGSGFDEILLPDEEMFPGLALLARRWWHHFNVEKMAGQMLGLDMIGRSPLERFVTGLFNDADYRARLQWEPIKRVQDIWWLHSDCEPLACTDELGDNRDDGDSQVSGEGSSRARTKAAYNNTSVQKDESLARFEARELLEQHRRTRTGEWIDATEFDQRTNEQFFANPYFRYLQNEDFDVYIHVDPSRLLSSGNHMSATGTATNCKAVQTLMEFLRQSILGASHSF